MLDNLGEIFGLNYEWCFLAVNLNELFIGSKFINENSLTQLDKVKGKKYHIVYTLAANEGSYSIMDLKGIGTRKLDITDIYIDDSGSNSVKIGFQTDTNHNVTARTWAVVDENNDIYFASNVSATFNTSGTQYHLIFYTRKSRI